MTVRVIVTTPASEHVLAIIERWRQSHTAAPYLFEDELTAALELLAKQPEIGVRDERFGVPGLRRLRLQRSRYHVYYVHMPELGEVHVRAVWGAVRGRGPDIDL